MATYIYEEIDEDEKRLREIQVKGKTVWDDEEYIQRPKISPKTKEKWIDAIINSNFKEANQIMFELLTGKTVQETKDQLNL